MKSELLHVLIVDDDPDDFKMLKDLLSEIPGRKFQTDWASSYDQGKAMLLKRAHDVCFLDFRLGPRTGVDLLREAIGEGCKTPIILLTGYGEHEVDLEAMRIGAADYLVKDQIEPILLERSMRYSIHRRKLEAQVLMQDRMASVGLLASSLAHEIGTPLGVIRGRAEYLAIQTQDSPEIHKNVDIIVSQIDRVSKLIRSLLNLARGERARGRDRVPLREIVEEVVELMAHETRRHSIEVHNEIGAAVAAAVSAEAEPLHQVVLNLLVNSVQAIETAISRGRTAGHRITVSAADKGANWALRVEDTGCGISQENLRNLFKPFFTTKEIGVGTGLGLATSYRIVESWGGSIQVESTEGTGTSFTVLLPKAKD